MAKKSFWTRLKNKVNWRDVLANTSAAVGAGLVSVALNRNLSIILNLSEDVTMFITSTTLLFFMFIVLSIKRGK